VYPFGSWLHDTRHDIAIARFRHQRITLRGDQHDYLATWNSIPARRAGQRGETYGGCRSIDFHARQCENTGNSVPVSDDVEMTNL
jgi:hypothetical protein